MRMKMASNSKAACILFVLRRQADDDETAVLRVRIKKKNYASYEAKKATIYCTSAVAAATSYFVSCCFMQSLDKDEARQNLTYNYSYIKNDF